MSNVPDRVRTACAWVAARARSVAIEAEAIEAYAAGLPTSLDPPEPATEIVAGNP